MIRIPQLFPFIVALSCSFTGYSQPVNLLLGDISSPSPEAAALGKYADIPVSQFTGTPDITVPIHTLKEGPISLPIYLSYHASGIRVQEAASWVGLGWSLSAGGMITRTVLGFPDDSPQGYYRNRADIDLLYETGQIISVANGQQMWDLEPDLFSFNFAGYSGKFMLDKNGEAHIFPRQDLKIVIGDDAFNRITIVTPDGTQYVFGTYIGMEPNETNQMIETTQAQYGNPQQTSPYISSWYLVEIRSHDDKHRIVFEYDTERLLNTMLSSCEIVFNKCEVNLTGSGPGVYLNRSQFNVNPYQCQGELWTNENVYVISTEVKGKRLKRITTTYTTVEFKATTTRTDLTASAGSQSQNEHPKRLDHIEIRTGNYCADYTLAYSYFTDPVHANLSAGKRLKLEQVSQSSCSGSQENAVSIPPYIFHYEAPFNGDGTQFMPFRFDKNIDHWGFYNYNGTTDNNDNNAANQKLNIPPVTAEESDFPHYEVEVPYYEGAANRETHPEKVKYGVLNKITYPTSGSTHFTFEANSYVDGQEQSMLHLENCENLDEECCQVNYSSAAYTFTNEQIQLGPAIRLALYVSTYLEEEFPGDNCGEARQISFQIINTSTNQTIAATSFNIDMNQGPVVSDRMEAPIRELLVDGQELEANTLYLFTITVYGGKGTLDLLTVDPSNIQNKPAGGLRIKEIVHSKDNTPSADDIRITYAYHTESGNYSSGVLFRKPVYGYVSALKIPAANFTSFYVTFREESVMPLGNFDGLHIGYSRIVEDHNGIGEKVYLYETYTDIKDVFMPAIPRMLNVRNGKLSKSFTYDEESNLVAQTQHFPQDPNYTQVPGPIGKIKQLTGCSSVPFGNRIAIVLYAPKTAIYRLKDVIETQDGVDKKTSYTYYDQYPISIPKWVGVTNSDGKVHGTETEYAVQTGEECLEDAFMVGIPVIELKKVGGSIVGGKRIEFDNCYPKKYFELLQGANNGSPVELLRGEISSYNADGYPNGYIPMGFPQIVYQWNNKRLDAKTYEQWNWEYKYKPGTVMLDKVKDIDGQLVIFDYDAIGRLKTVTKREGNIIIEYEYIYGAVNKIITTTTYTDAPTQIVEQEFDGLGRPIRTIHNEVVKNEIKYDKYGRIEKET